MAINKNKVNDAALKFIQKGQIKKAIKEYEKILAEDPGDVRTLLKKGDLLVRIAEKAEAVDTYLKVAAAYSSQGFHLKAVAVYKQILKIDEGRIDVNLRLADEYQNLGIASDAMNHLQVVADYYEQQGQSKESLDIFRRIVELDPDNVASRIKLAELYSREGMVAEAVEDFTKAAEDLKNQNRIEDYIKVAERLIYHDSSNIQLVKELANIYLQRGDTKRALGKLQICFKADPQDLETLNLLATAFQDLNQISKTVSVYKEMAKIHREQGNLAEMQQVYRRILDLSPDDPEARQALQGGGKREAPGEDFADVTRERPMGTVTQPTAPQRGPRVAEPAADELELEAEPAPEPEPELEVLSDGEATMAVERPDLSPPPQAAPPAPLPDQARETISRLLTETDVYVKYGLQNKAFEHLKKVFELDPNNLEGHGKLKDLYLAAGQTDAAVAELLTLAQIAERLGRGESARTYLAELLSLDPGNADGRALAARLGDETPLEEDRPVEPEAAPPPVESITSEADIILGDGEVAVEEDLEIAVDDLAAEPGELAEETAPPPVEEQFLDLSEAQDVDAPAESPVIQMGDDLPEGGLPPEDLSETLPAPDDDLLLMSPDEEPQPGVTRPAARPPVREVQEPILLDDSPAPVPEEWAGLDATPSPAVAEPEEEDDIGETATMIADLDSMDPGDLLGRGAATELPLPPPIAPEPAEAQPPVELPSLDDDGLGDETADVSLLSTGVYPKEGPAKFLATEPAQADETPVVLDAETASQEEPELIEMVDDEDFVEEPAGDEEPLRPAPAAAPPRPQAEPRPEPKPEPRPPVVPPPPVSPSPASRTAAPSPAPAPKVAAAPPAKPPVAAAEPAEAPAAEEDDELEESLEEVDFFIQQNLLDEAVESLEALASRHPDHPGIRQRQEKIRSLQQGPAPAAEAPQAGAFDLAAELEREVSSETSALSLDEDFQYSVEDVFSEFKKGVAKVVEKEDSATHFDLGIAYKEMGLIDDAISEFTVAAADAGRRPTALTMVGLCLLEKGQYSDAINRFKDALHSPGIAEDQATAVYFEMAQAYEMLKDKGEALFYFNKVQKRDPKFRDVDERIQKLIQSGAVSRPESEEPRPASEPKGPKPPVPPGGRKISYM